MTNIHFSSTSTLLSGSRCIFCMATLLAITTGCGSSSQRLTQLQNENDRLLSEYRAQRDQVTQANEKLAVLQNRLAESEKLLARQSPMPASRMSRLNDPGSLPSSVPTFGTQSHGTASGSIAAGAAGVGASNKPNGSGDTGSNASSASELSWRPMRREAP